MKYLELSKEKSAEAAKALWLAAEKDFSPDAILFVSKGAFYIGLSASAHFRVPLYEVRIKKTENFLKKFAAPFLRVLPAPAKRFLRAAEIKSYAGGLGLRIREVFCPDEEIYSRKKILLVDDSIDTGSAILSVREHFKPYGALIKTAAFNVMSYAANNSAPDYALYKNVLISGPWSKDSPEYEEFKKNYQSWAESRG